METKNQNMPWYIAVTVSGTVVLFALIFLFFLGFSENIQIENKRNDETFVRIEKYTRKEIPDESTPAGTRVEYEFWIGEDLKRDASLAFYTVHQYVEVYIGDEEVYRLYPSKELSGIRTTGSNWIVIPLYREDIGSRVRVMLTPVYENVVGREVEFLMGSYQAIYTDRLKQDLPALVISGLIMVTGAILIIMGIYSRYRYKLGWRMVMFGIFAECLALWRMGDLRFSPFMKPDKPVMLFYISLIALMFSVIPFMFSQRKRMDAHIMEYYIIAVSGIGIVQLMLQVLGIADLRQTLAVTHGLIIAGALLMGSMLVKKNSLYSERKNYFRRVVMIALPLGGVADLICYYAWKTSNGLLFAMSGLLLYIIYIGISSIDTYIQQREKLMESEHEIVQIRASAMMTQIKSHMVFNILNAISGMCKYDPEKADRIIVCFARYLRTNINLMEDDRPVPFRSVLQNLEDYVALEQVRFGDRIRFVKDIQEKHFVMPDLILQPLVENAIKHGIGMKPEGGTITLRTWSEGDMIHISIHDDGVGFDVSQTPKTGSVGLKNVRSRLEYIMHGRLDIESIPGQGTTATVCISRKEIQECM